MFFKVYCPVRMRSRESERNGRQCWCERTRMVSGWTKGSSRSGSSRGKKPRTSQVANNNNGHTGLLKLAVVDLVGG
jgi:hypothetical protein